MLRFFFLLISVTPTLVTSDGRPTPTPYLPCQNWVTVLADISNKLNTDQFGEQIMFMQDIIEHTNYFERIQYGAYFGGNGNMTYKWNDANTKDGIIQSILNTRQTSHPPSLAGAMRLLTNFANKNSTAIVFVSDTTNAIQILTAVNLYNSALKGNVKLTFILAGQNTNAQDLKSFDDAIIFNWQNIVLFGKPDGWNVTAGFRCEQQTSPTMAPYIPCKSWIYFGIDDSNVLDQTSFTRHLKFISSAIGNITHSHRIAAAGMYSTSVPWDSGITISEIQSDVMAMHQTGGYSLRRQIVSLLTNLRNIQINTMPVAAVIFISDTSSSALEGALDLFSAVPNIEITFVLLGSNPDQSKLTQFSSNFIFWKDLSQPQPNSWDTLSYGALGCQ